MSVFRDNLAAAFRALPPVRGKGRVGVAIGRRLWNVADDNDCIVTFPMKDGTLMQVDVRSATEQWAFWTGQYDSRIIARLASCLEPGSVAFDVGANVGFYSAPLGRTLKGLGGKLYAFEPVPNNFARLQHVIALNKLQEVVQPMNIALGDKEGEVFFRMETRNGACTGNAALTTAGSTEAHVSSARMVTLDALAEEQNITACRLIKIDVEGNEYMFLKGGQSFLSKHRPIIYGEFNRGWMKEFGQSFLDVVALVRPWGYRFYQQTGGDHFAALDEPKEGDQDILLVPEGTASQVLAGLGVIHP